MATWLDVMFPVFVIGPLVVALGLWLFNLVGKEYHRIQARRLQDEAAHSIDIEY